MQMKKSKIKQNQITIFNKSSPVRVSLLVTHRCLYKCNHCHIWKYKNAYKRLNLKEINILLKDLSNMYGNNVEIYIGGSGMIELNKYLIPILKISKSYGFKTILTTNAHLINQRILKRLIIDANLDTIVVSLDYLNKSKHDSQRGVSGSYDRVLRLLNYLSIYKGLVQTTINCLIMKPNIDELVPIAYLINSSPTISCVSYHLIARPPHSDSPENWIEDKRFSHLWPDDIDKITLVFNELIKLRQKQFKIANSVKQLQYFKQFVIDNKQFLTKKYCDSEKLGLEISHNGTVTICPQKKSIGNLKDNSLNNQLQSQEFTDLSSEIQKCTANCHFMQNCRYSD
jgi:MoaA/NifB/PqqE/SkfB family radical SAM enzyme